MRDGRFRLRGARLQIANCNADVSIHDSASAVQTHDSKVISIEGSLVALNVEHCSLRVFLLLLA